MLGPVASDPGGCFPARGGVRQAKRKGGKEWALPSLDASDVKRCLAGDREAYAQLVERYQGTVTKRMMRFTRNLNECEELVQTVFVKAYRTLGSYRGEGPFLHWLGIICTRVGYDFWGRKRHAGGVTLADSLERIDTASDDCPTPTEAAEIAHALLARLPKADRLVLTLMYLEDCSTKEIAERTGWNRAAVKMRALRARRRIKAIAEERRLLERLGWIR